MPLSKASYIQPAVIAEDSTNTIGKLGSNSGTDIGDVTINNTAASPGQVALSPQDTLDHGSNLDIDASAEQVTATSFTCEHGVIYTADQSNSGVVYLGNSDVTAGDTAATDGIPLSAGESVWLPITNPNLIYGIGSAADQKVYWLAI